MSDSDDLVPSASSRQPRSILPLDDGLPGVIDPDALPVPESEERQPASRKVASVRGTELDLDVEDFSRWELDGLATDPPSTRKTAANVDRKTPTEAALVRIERQLTDVDTAAPEVVRRTLPETELVVLLSSTRAFRPTTFGELLDAALDLDA